MKQHSNLTQSNTKQSNHKAKQSHAMRSEAYQNKAKRIAAKPCREIQCKAMPDRARQNNATAKQRRWLTRLCQQERMQAIARRRNTLAQVTGLGGLLFIASGWWPWPWVILAFSMQAGVQASMHALRRKMYYFAKVDTLGIETRASHMLPGWDTTTPCDL